jgi:hypothetical protein
MKKRPKDMQARSESDWHYLPRQKTTSQRLNRSPSQLGRPSRVARIRTIDSPGHRVGVLIGCHATG